MTRAYVPTNWCDVHGELPKGHEAPSEHGVAVEVLDHLVALFLAFVGGWLFATWQQAHWIVNH